MDLEKLYPWNWFKHEDSREGRANIPVRRADSGGSTATPAPSPEHPLVGLHADINRMFDDAFRNLPGALAGSGLDAGAFRPSINVSSSDDSYLVTVEAPGMDREDIAIEVKEDVLTLTGRKREESEEKGRHFYRVERRYGEFQRILSLPGDADVDGIIAAMNNGVVSVTIPRKESEIEARRQIEIK